MEVNYSLLFILDIVLLVQGILLGIVLITLDRKQQKKTFFLGVFTILFGLTSVPGIIGDLNLTGKYSKLEYLPFDFVWLLFPIFYLYVQEISIFSSKKNYYILFPGIIEFLFMSSLFFFNEDIQADIIDSFLYFLFFLSGIIFSIIIVIKTFLLTNRHAKSLQNQYSSLEYKEIKWVKYYTLGILLYFSFSFIAIIFAVIMEEAEDLLNLVEIIISIINFIFVFWASFKGITQQNVTLLIPEEKIKIDINDTEDKSSKLRTFRENDKSTEKTIKNLLQVIEEDQIFKNVNLTIVNVSEKIGVHPRKLSVIINSSFGLNFNQFINNYRVEYTKKLLYNNLENNLTIEGVAFEAGFKSKSAFYVAFKTHTQMTPINFKKSICKKNDVL